MTSDKKGYVYILTNPSFRSDWIKIGKSSREVDVRSKELDNTAVPLPFEIYATLKTSKYNVIERKLHTIFTDLADARIRKNREFFNISPDKALVYLKLEAETLNDAELNIPDEILDEVDDYNDNKIKKRTYKFKGKYVVDTDEIFYFYRDGTDARMKVMGGNRYILLEGSKIAPDDRSDYIHSRRAEYKGKIKDLVTVSDIEFTNPSAAGILVAGGHVNGKFYWRTKDGRKLDDFIRYI
jgi:hypothetical protein